MLKILLRLTSRKKITSCLLSLALLGLVGCGGGTSGTGDTSSDHIRGNLQNLEGLALSNAQIIDLESGAETTSDQAGNFDLKTEINTDNPSLLIKTDQIDSTVTLDGVVAGTHAVNTIITVDQVTGIVSAVVVNIELEDGTKQLPSKNLAQELKGLQKSPSNNKSKTPKKTQKQPVWNFVGTIYSSSGSRFKAVDTSVRYNSTGPAIASTLSDNAGQFNLQALAQGSTARLDFIYKGAKGSLRLNQLPLSNAKISLSIRLSIEVAVIDPHHPTSGNTVLKARVQSVKIQTTK